MNRDIPKPSDPRARGKVLRFICEWNAKDAKSVQDVFDKVPELPVDGIYPMAKLDSVDFRE